MTPTTRECFDRLAKVGVVPAGVIKTGGGEIGFMVRRKVNETFSRDEFVELDNGPILEALLCDAVLRKHPEWTVKAVDGGWFFVCVHRHDGEKSVADPGKSRLAALTLAAERVAKEKA